MFCRSALFLSFCENRFCLSQLIKKLNSTERGAPFQHFCVSKVITTAHAHKSGVIFHFFPRAFKPKKIKALRPKMTKIASRGSCLNLIHFVDEKNFSATRVIKGETGSVKGETKRESVNSSQLCDFLVRESVNSSPILARQGWRHFRLSLSLSLSLPIAEDAKSIFRPWRRGLNITPWHYFSRWNIKWCRSTCLLLCLLLRQNQVDIVSENFPTLFPWFRKHQH